MKNNKNMFIMIGIFVAIVILIVILSVNLLKKENKIEKGSYKDTNIEWVKEWSDGTQVNVSDEIIGPKEFEGLTLQETQLTSNENKTDLIIRVKNNTDEDIPIKLVVVTLLDKDGNEIVKLNGIINPTKAGEETQTFKMYYRVKGSNGYQLKEVQESVSSGGSLRLTVEDSNLMNKKVFVYVVIINSDGTRTLVKEAWIDSSVSPWKTYYAEA